MGGSTRMYVLENPMRSPIVERRADGDLRSRERPFLREEPRMADVQFAYHVIHPRLKIFAALGGDDRLTMCRRGSPPIYAVQTGIVEFSLDGPNYIVKNLLSNLLE